MSDNTPITAASRYALELKAKSGWRAFFRMRDRYDNLTNYLDNKNAELRAMRDAIKVGEEVDITHLKRQFIELYEKVGEMTECPVCFETLTKEIIDIPNCGHMVCKGCKSKMVCCPLCKAKYSGKK
jgi:hypothetical protein